MSQCRSLRQIASWVLIVLGLLATCVKSAHASTVVPLTWHANTESDLAGYRILWGTTPGNYTQAIDVGNVTSYVVAGLIAEDTYYFVVVAYDQAGNVSGPSNEIVITCGTYSLDATDDLPTADASVGATNSTTSTPTVISATELTAKSNYIPRPGVRHIQVVGIGFQRGAVLSLGPGILSNSIVFVDERHLMATLTVEPAAALGPRTLTVTNPDRGSGHLPAALTVVRSSGSRRHRELHPARHRF